MIIQFWDDLNNIPSDVQDCLDSWEPLSSKGFTRLLFDDQKARDFIVSHFGSRYADAFDRCYHPAMRCDYFRLCYIVCKGGFYVDADEVFQGKDIEALFRDDRLKLQPLCYDIESGSMIEPDVFITADEVSPHWIFYFNNNPIISPARHPIIAAALERATHLLMEDATLPEIQATTGPGNLTASLVQHSLTKELAGKEMDFVVVTDWQSISVSAWPLSYRNDSRNWRLFNLHESTNKF